MTALSATGPVSAPAQKLRIVSRYVLSTGGPASVSAAHFLASILILHALPPREFGIFAFVLIIVPLCMSAAGAMLISSLTHVTANAGAFRDGALAAHLKANLLFSLAAMLLSGALIYASGAGTTVAALLGIYGGVMSLRWVARATRFIANDPVRVAASDFCYSLCLVAGFGTMWMVKSFTIGNAAAMMAASAIAATACFGGRFLKQQFISSLEAPIAIYAASWRSLTRWSLLGVLLTEATANAHAYLVTFVAGSQSFALLAVGALFMRPVSLCLSALSDVERPFMARSIAGGNVAGAERCMREFRLLAAAIWLGTGLLCAAALIWLPSLVLKNYRLIDVATVAALWGAIMAARLLRTPESVLLQAAGEFEALARTTYLSSAVSIALTLVLLLAFGPIASLLGILAGDGVMTAQIFGAANKWRRANG